MSDLAATGIDWLIEKIEALPEQFERVDPVKFNEETRYLPESVTPRPGFISYDINPYMREILECASPDSPVREVNLLKGVQITYTTLLESILFYYIAAIKTAPCMWISADKELTQGRIENYILPMLQHSDKMDLIQSSDAGNGRKTGKTAKHLQWQGGGFMIPEGANNAAKMRQWSILLMLKDELDGWPDYVGKDGEPDSVTDDRCSAYWEKRKIFRGSTPLLAGNSKITAAYNRGDQRKYYVRCKHCGYPQELRWHTEDKETGVVGGINWEMENGVLVPGSVRYLCQNCGHEHTDYDKRWLFDPDNGAEWRPTAKPVHPSIRSYHLPALYSPQGFASWEKCVLDYLAGYDHERKVVTDIGKYQKFYNNVLARPFEMKGARVRKGDVLPHRRSCYKMGEVPNEFAAEYCGSPVLFLTCTVDVQGDWLAIGVFGHTINDRVFAIHYEHATDDKFKTATDPNDPMWDYLAEFYNREFTADDGRVYAIEMMFVDAGYAQDAVVSFCERFEGGVFPILGRERPAKNQSVVEFGEWKTKSGITGFRITVDHYKDRMAASLRREWFEELGSQAEYHFNAPRDIKTEYLLELTRETRRKKVAPNGTVSFYWDRQSSNARNELWDLLGYAYAQTEILAWNLCVENLEQDRVDWPWFWEYMADQLAPVPA